MEQCELNSAGTAGERHILIDVGLQMIHRDGLALTNHLPSRASLSPFAIVVYPFGLKYLMEMIVRQETDYHNNQYVYAR